MPRGRQGENNDGLQRKDADRLDRAFGLLSDRTRRAILRYFRDTADDTASFEVLGDHLARSNEADLDPETVTIAVHHWILPKLEEGGVIEYDDRSETVRYRPQPIVDDLLDRIDRWSRAR